MRLMRQTLERFQAIQERSAERCKDSAEEPVSVEVVMAAFETVASIAARQAGDTDEL